MTQMTPHQPSCSNSSINSTWRCKMKEPGWTCFLIKITLLNSEFILLNMTTVVYYKIDKTASLFFKTKISFTYEYQRFMWSARGHLQLDYYFTQPHSKMKRKLKRTSLWCSGSVASLMLAEYPSENERPSEIFRFRRLLLRSLLQLSSKFFWFSKKNFFL